MVMQLISLLQVHHGAPSDANSAIAQNKVSLKAGWERNDCSATAERKAKRDQWNTQFTPLVFKWSPVWEKKQSYCLAQQIHRCFF